MNTEMTNHSAALLTESVNPRSLRLDKMSTLEIVELMNREDGEVIQVVHQALPQITALINNLLIHFRNNGRLFYVGAGTSGRLGVLDASECPPTFGSDPLQVQALMAGGPPALIKAVENAEDDPEAGAQELRDRHLSSDDFVIGISASGNTPFALGAIEEAGRVGAGTGAVVCNLNSPMAQAALYPVELPVGPEILCGSTRLKAGTATKLVLNMITTASMVQLGHCVSNMMVDVQANNAKLVRRKAVILAHLANLDMATAQQYLQLYDGDLRRAMKSCGLDI